MRYVFAVTSILIVTAVALVLQSYDLRDAELPALVLAIGIVTWYAGSGPAAVAVVLAAATFNYLFVEPIYTFYVSGQDLPYFVIFVLSAVTVTFFSSVRRRSEESLRQARDRLQIELDQRQRREGEIRRLNQELTLRASELAAANKELESFTYSVSHDLRAPLRHLVGFSELLRKHASSSLDEKGQKYVETIFDAGKRMGSLIDDLLTFSRIGRTESRMATVDLQGLITEAIAEVKQQTNGRDIHWEVGAFPACHGDRSLLKLVMLNLLSNAVKFSSLRKPARIEVGALEGSATSVEIYVKDNGVGFDMEYSGKLFGVFQRLHRTDEFEGTGIGLATVQRIAQRHGGSVRAEGAVDRGATFYVSLPREKCPVERAIDASCANSGEF